MRAKRDSIAARNAPGNVRLPPQPMAPERARLGKIRQTERAARSLKESPPMRFCGLPRFSHLRPAALWRQSPTAISACAHGKKKGPLPGGNGPVQSLGGVVGNPLARVDGNLVRLPLSPALSRKREMEEDPILIGSDPVPSPAC